LPHTDLGRRPSKIQLGTGCGDTENCSADARFTLDPDNYTFTFSTGYPACIPSTQVRNGALGASTGANAAGVGDALCPATNRPGAPVADSRFFAPLLAGDWVTADGNFETVNLVRFFSAHTALIGA